MEQEALSFRGKCGSHYTYEDACDYIRWMHGACFDKGWDLDDHYCLLEQLIGSGQILEKDWAPKEGR
jgi:hypothetical protein